MRGLPLTDGEHLQPLFVPSPDGKWLYMTGAGHAVLRRATDGQEPAKALIGDGGKPGSDNQSLNAPAGLDCDAQGRLYVCDTMNNRIQVFTPDGKFLKSIAMESPSRVRVHQKTGALYVKHAARVQGQKVDRLSKLTSLDAPNEEFHLDGLTAVVMTLDSWTPKPRLWLAGSGWDTGGAVGSFGRGLGVTVWEEDGKSLKKILDFDEAAKQEAGPNYLGRWSGIGSVGDKVVCDPVREEVYYQGSHQFNLATGAYRGAVKIPAGGIYDDIAFDKRGYLHLHLNPGFDGSKGGVVRVDPEQKYIEVPYDYGIERPGHYGPERLGALPVRDQPGAKYFQDGIGVNMRGDVAENCNIYYVPKMSEIGEALAFAGVRESGDGSGVGGWGRAGLLSHDGGFLREIMERQKRGEEVYSIKRRPGVPLAGATIWTFDYTGELRDECAVTAGGLVNATQIDEDGKLYFVTNRIRLLDGKTPFLAGSTGIFGAPELRGKQTLKVGTLLKTRGKDVTLLTAGTPIPLEPLPERPADLINAPHGVLAGKVWVEGAEWLYAGTGPIVFESCSCPAQRLHLDWYKRTYVPESYRHSIGILDVNGNLIMHLGRYGNFDSLGPNAKIPVGGDGIAAFMPRYIGGTDNYLAYDFRGEALVVLKLNYHAEETVPIRMK
jgi:hypothetical protein